MSNENFVDYVKINCQSGNGGKGSSHFYRAKGIPKGGPDGGDGGRGGDIILRGDRNKWTLLHLKFRKHVKAGHGGDGSGNHRFGAAGEDVVLDVPLGTLASLSESGEKLAEITEHGEEIIILQGGRGGLGNSHFKTPTNQAPRYSQPGEEGLEQWVILELKLLADVGLVGFPNAGKSTLLSVVSAAKPKVADYAFTTLVPNLGIVEYRDERSFVMADIPGIIEGAHEGKGLGTRFLRHIERNAMLLYMISCDSNNLAEEYGVLQRELQLYNEELLLRPSILVVTKCDMLDEDLIQELRTELQGVVHQKVCFISSLTGQGILPLKDEIWKTLNSELLDA